MFNLKIKIKIIYKKDIILESFVLDLSIVTKIKQLIKIKLGLFWINLNK